MSFPTVARALVVAVAIFVARGGVAGADGGFRIDTWTTDQGLPNDTVAGLVQTRDGYLWISTNAGLARFDGVRFELFNTRNTPELASDGCGALFEDRDGVLWIPTLGGGVTRLEGGRFKGYGRADGLSFEYGWTFLQDRSGKLWFGTNDKLHVWDGTGFHTFAANVGLATDRQQPLPMFEDADGTVWFLDVEGKLGSWSDGTYRRRREGEGPIPASIEGAARPWRGSPGVLWVTQAQPARLSRVRGREVTSFELSPISSHEGVARLLESRRGDVWAGLTESGLRLVRDGRVTAIDERDGLSDNLVTALAEDREGNIWVGTHAGLNRVKPKVFSMLAAREGLADERVWSVYEDRRGDVWMGTETVLCRLHDGDIVCYGPRDGLGRGAVSLVEDHLGQLWVGTTRGLSRLSNGSFVTYTVRDGLSHDNVRALYEDRRGRLWIGTSAGGLNVYEGGRFRAYTTQDGLAANWVRYIHEDAAGDLWICTTGGVSRLRDGAITTFTTADGLADNHVLTAHEDPDGAMWFGTYRRGLSRYKDGRFSTITAADGLLDDAILHLLEDGRGQFWISSTRGIFRVSRRALDDFAEGRRSRVESVGYGKTDGLATLDCGGGTQPAGWRTRDGRLLFPTSRGVAVVDPEAVEANAVPPPVVLEQVVYDNLQAPAGGGAILPPGTKTVEFRYTALSLTAPEKVRFRHRLEGYDSDWIDDGTRRAVYYTHLPPGGYRFRVLAANDDGVWNETGTSYDFSLEPYFYQTRWFYAACLLLVASAAWSIHRLRLRQTEARYAAVLAERSRIARELHDTIAQGFAGVSMQLEAVSARLRESPDEARENLDRARLLVRASLADARRTVRDLRPQLLESGDLAAALAAAASAISATGGVRVDVAVRGARRQLPSAVENQLFRVGQEALTNAVRHGRPGAVRIVITYDRHSVELVVEDDGRGFGDAAPASRDGGGLGLVGMRERMQQIGGSLEVTSEPGRGTRVRAVASLGGAEKIEP